MKKLSEVLGEQRWIQIQRSSLKDSIRNCVIGDVTIWDIRQMATLFECPVVNLTLHLLEGVAYSPGRRLTSFIRYCFMVPADPREVNSEEGAFMMSDPPIPFKPSEFGHLPQHWYSHAMHALEVIGYRHPDLQIRVIARKLYEKMVSNLHLEIEPFSVFVKRLSEDRIESNTVVS